MANNTDIENNDKQINELLSKVEKSQFSIENVVPFSYYFPEVLKQKLSCWMSYFNEKLKPLLDDAYPKETEIHTQMSLKIEQMCTAFEKALEKYYFGNVFEATKIFNEGLSTTFNKNVFPSVTTIASENNFFRGRKNELKPFTIKDLFHVPFEFRHMVSTNRYSIPGLPALYLADTTYVIYEEFLRYSFKDISFSRFVNKKHIYVIEILRIEDFLEKIRAAPTSGHLKRTLFRGYLITFPLIIACTLRVANENGAFKPEYIIPQLLLQYVTTNTKIDGIKYPSSKIDYSKINGFPAYNYVFPVKQVESSGFCLRLVDQFHMTQPTSLEIEELIHNIRYGLPVFSNLDERTPSLDINGSKNSFRDTAFGRIDNALIYRNTQRII